MSDKDEYDVGYGKPPKSGMFKKGQSGNPGGRRKRVKNFQTELHDMLATKVAVNVAGKPKSVGTVPAALMRLREKALKGDPRALDSLLKYAEGLSQASENRAREGQLNDFEQDILRRSGWFDEPDNAEGSDDA